MTNELITIEKLSTMEVLKWETPVILFEGQLIPINPPYSKNANYFVAEKDMEINKYFEVNKGDELYLSLFGEADCANSYKLCNATKPQSIALLNLIPDVAEGSFWNDDFDKHYDALLQIKNLNKIIKGELETVLEAQTEAIKILSTMIPDVDFYTAKPFNSKYGFESPHKVIIENGKYIKLRDDHWITAAEYKKELKRDIGDEREFNVWDEFNNKEDIAWSIYHNAMVILTENEVRKKSKYDTLWDKQFDLVHKMNIERYALKKK